VDKEKGVQHRIGQTSDFLSHKRILSLSKGGCGVGDNCRASAVETTVPQSYIWRLPDVLGKVLSTDEEWVSTHKHPAFRLRPVQWNSGVPEDVISKTLRERRTSTGKDC
jgi:hypothetical protein